MTIEQQLIAAQEQLAEAHDMLKEVQPYRSTFFKQRVAHWQALNIKIFNQNNMELLKEQTENILQALMADEGTKAILKGLIEKQLQVNPYQAACAKLGKTPVPELQDKSDADIVWADNALRLITCIRAKNMIPQPDGTFKLWIPTYDGSESHYWPVADMSSSPGFSFNVYGHWNSGTTVGARLEYRTDELAEEGFEEFKEYYRIHMSPPAIA